MSKLTDKVSYLKGLAAGMKLNMEKDSNKLLLEILGAMGDMAEEMQRMDEAHRELQDYVESIDDDLSDLTETLFSDEEEDDEDADDADECDCEDCASDFIAAWPMVWGSDGCLWGRMHWPAGFVTEGDGYILRAAP